MSLIPDLVHDPIQVDLAERIRSDLFGNDQTIPVDFAHQFSPAKHWLFEWKDYFIDLPDVDYLFVGGQKKEPLKGSVFLIRFENQLGLSTIQPFRNHAPICPPFHVEVISRKFPTLQSHINFYSNLLDDLFSQAIRLPFHISTDTKRAVIESLRPPTPLFVLHFLSQFASDIIHALNIIQSNPHRILSDNPALVSLGEAIEADGDVLISILQHSDQWVQARGFPLATQLGGYAPTHVWQRLPEETYNTPENQFILSFINQILVAADNLPSQTWWGKVDSDRKKTISTTASFLRQIITLPLFDEVDTIHHLPSSSQVLLRKEGYRDLLYLWQIFQQSRKPMFEPLQQAMEMRDIASLYEIWAFFALVEELSVQLEMTPRITFATSVEHGLEYKAKAQYGSFGTLSYNQGFIKHSYSVPLRPDFTWLKNGIPEVVFDAKFRLERITIDEAEQEDLAEASAKRSDLYKMHTYRDAMRLRSAVIVYPGDKSVFFDQSLGKLTNPSLRDILLGNLRGIGAIQLSPIMSSSELQMEG